ncbi:hypothetical protein AX14_013354 [Amanita brunnescens Koide BX004]|nr:hypothetical protein AX14_013354 [Amanita brunnescens Koide BX004]
MRPGSSESSDGTTENPTSQRICQTPLPDLPALGATPAATSDTLTTAGPATTVPPATINAPITFPNTTSATVNITNINNPDSTNVNAHAINNSYLPANAAPTSESAPASTNAITTEDAQTLLSLRNAVQSSESIQQTTTGQATTDLNAMPAASTTTKKRKVNGRAIKRTTKYNTPENLFAIDFQNEQKNKGTNNEFEAAWIALTPEQRQIYNDRSTAAKKSSVPVQLDQQLPHRSHSWRFHGDLIIVDAIERNTRPPRSRALGMRAATLETLDHLQVVDDLMAHGTKATCMNAYTSSVVYPTERILEKSEELGIRDK